LVISLTLLYYLSKKIVRTGQLLLLCNDSLTKTNLQMRAMKTSFLLVAIVLVFAGCQRDDDDGLQQDITQSEADAAAATVQSLLLAQEAFSKGYDEVQIQAGQQSDLNGFTGEVPASPRSNCPAVTFTTDPDTFWPAILTLDYGDGCNDEDNVGLSGRITATFNGLLIGENTQIGIAFDAFTVNNYALSGSFNVSNDGLDGQGRQSFSSQIIGGTFSQGGVVLLNYDQEASSYQVAGQNTNFFTNGFEGIFDDVFEETIMANGTGVAGNPFSITTETPLVDPLNCRWDVSGRLVYTLSTLPVPAILDFGDGTCDNDATLIIGAFSYPIEL
ncbi:MAG: hypothetical protein AAFU67_18810, partial [Bacteroidota bacterium]